MKMQPPPPWWSSIVVLPRACSNFLESYAKRRYWFTWRNLLCGCVWNHGTLHMKSCWGLLSYHPFRTDAQWQVFATSLKLLKASRTSLMHLSTQWLMVMTPDCLTSHSSLCLNVESMHINIYFSQVTVLLQTGTACQGKLHRLITLQPLKGIFHTFSSFHFIFHNNIIYGTHFLLAILHTYADSTIDKKKREWSS